MPLKQSKCNVRKADPQKDINSRKETQKKDTKIKHQSCILVLVFFLCPFAFFAAIVVFF
jgi:hypothetical protein